MFQMVSMGHDKQSTGHRNNILAECSETDCQQYLLIMAKEAIRSSGKPSLKKWRMGES